MVDRYTYYDHSLVESKLVSVFDKPSTMIMVFLSFCFTLISIGASGFVGLLRKVWKRKFMPLVGGSNIMMSFIMLLSIIGKGGHKTVWDGKSLTLNIFPQ